MKDLDETQQKAIASLSKNDEDEVIAKKIKEVHSQYDADIESVTGKKKGQFQKTYDFMKEVLADLKKKAEAGEGAKALQDQIDALTQEKKDLEEQIKKGSGDETLKKTVADLTKKLADKTSELTTFKETAEKEKKEVEDKISVLEKKSLESEIDRRFDAALKADGVKLISTIPKEIMAETLENRKKALLSSVTTDYVDDGDGKKTLVFRGADGNILRNKEKQNDPMTAEDMFLSKIGDLLDGGRQQPGTGKKPSERKPGDPPSTFTLGAAKNQIEADKQIEEHVLKVEGIARTDVNFSERKSEIRKENKVSELPIR